MAVSLNTDASKKSRKQALAQMKANIERQKALIKSKTKALRDFRKRIKQTKGLNMTAKMQNEQIANSKEQDIFRTKQVLDRMKISYSKAYHNK